MKLLVLGGSSQIALATAAEFAAQDGAEIILASRGVEQLAVRARDLSVRFGVKAEAIAFDALDYASHAEFWNSLDPKPDGVIVAFGLLGDQERGQRDFDHAHRIIDTNLTGAVSILEIIAADMAQRRSGFIIGLGSVAGLRGRQSNYLYGTAKAGLIAYLSGLRNRLQPAGVNVLTVLPGFVRTKMTDGMDLPGALTAEPEAVAQDIHRAWAKGRSLIYTKWFWRWIMLIIRSIPEPIFKKLKL